MKIYKEKLLNKQIAYFLHHC